MNADKHDLKDLRQKSMKAICEDFENIPIDELRKIDGNVFCEILNNDEIAADETIIVDRLIRWLEGNELVRAEYAPKLLDAVQLKLIPAEVNDMI